MDQHFPRRSRLTSLVAVIAVTLSGLGLSVLTAPAAAAAAGDLSPVAARTDSMVTADALPTVQVDGVVWSQTVVGNTVYAGGSFASARPAGSAPGVNTTPRGNLLAYDITTGNLITSFAPVVNGQILSVSASPDGTKLYIAGDFTTVNGVTRNRVAAFNTATGALIGTFNPNLGTRVKTVVATNSTVYIGGLFAAANGQPRSRLAAFNAANGALLAWNPGADYNVNALVLTPDKTKVIVGGAFQNLGYAPAMTPAYGLAALDATSGAITPWAATDKVRNAGTSAAIQSLSTDGTNIFGTGYVFGAGGNLEGTFSADPTSGTINWIEDCHGDTYGAFSNGSAVYTVSHAHYCGNVGGFPQSDPWSTNQRYGIAFTPNATGTIGHDPLGYFDWAGNPSPSIVNWFPELKPGTVTGQGQAGWNVTGNSKYVVIGGEFPTVNGVGQQGLVRFATKAGAANKRGPMVTGVKFVPNLVSLKAGTVRVAFQSNWDQDDLNLTYKVVRNSNTAAPVFTTTGDSTFWNRPMLGFTDTGLTPGTTYRYRLYVNDAAGNQVAGDTMTITVPAGNPTSDYANLVGQQGASTYWRLGEAAGVTSAYDWAGYNDGVVASGVSRGAVGAINGDADTASTFDGTANGLVSAPIASIGSNTFTTEAWVNTTSTSGGKILGFGNAQTGTSNSYDRHIYMDNSGRIWFGVYANGVYTLNTTKSYNDGQWHQIVSSLGPNGMALYIDGLRVAVRGDTTGGQPYSGYWRVGGDSLGGWPAQPSSNFLNGSIDEVSFYPTALTRDQVLAQYVASGRTSPIPPAPADAYGAAVYTDQPDLFYRLAETSGITAADSGPSLNPGTYSGGVTQGVPGVLTGNTAGGFNGVDGLVASNNTFTNPTQYSEEAWFKTTTTRGGKIIGFGSSNTGTSGGYDRHVYMQDDGKLVFGTYTGQLNVITTPASYNNDQWHHVVATQGADGMKLYLDGQLTGTNPQTSAQDYTGYWRVGGDNTWGSSSAFFAGTIDEAAVYPTVLSPQRVTAHYQAGVPAAPNQAPTAAFTSTSANLALSVDGSGSTDADGTITGYAWNFGDGTTGTGATAQHTYAVAGNYTVTLTVTDNAGATNAVSKQVTVTAAPVNAAPTAAFTSTSANLALTVDGSGSTDADGTITGYAWNFGDGTTGTGATAQHTYGAAGNYTVTLTVTDNAGATNAVSKQVTVTAANAAPTAAFTASSQDLTVSVDGSTSVDSDGTIASYAWDFGDGSFGTGATASHTYAAGGSYTVKLTVTDNKGATGTQSQPVTVTAPVPNKAPTAAFDATTAGLTVSVDGGTSTDTDGTIASYAWTFGDGQSGTGTATSHTYGAAGTYPIKLTVTDNQGATGTITKSVTVTAPPPANVSPVAAFTSTTNGLTANLDGSTSSDPDGTIASYTWDFGDNASDTGKTVSHPYLTAGTYQVKLTVADNQGATNSVTKPVTVTNPATPAAIATDTFARTVAAGFGSAEFGGAWTPSGSATPFSVAAGVGKIKVATAGSGPLIWMNAVSAADLRGSVDVAYDKDATGGGTYTSVAVRRVGTSDYRFKVRIQPGSVQLQLSKVVNGVETMLKTQTIAGLTATAGQPLRLSFQAQGTGTTALSAKVWKVGATEPAAWQLTGTDTDPALQGPGAIGIQAYLAGTATNAPVVASIDNLTVGTIPAP